MAYNMQFFHNPFCIMHFGAKVRQFGIVLTMQLLINQNPVIFNGTAMVHGKVCIKPSLGCVQFS